MRRVMGLGGVKTMQIELEKIACFGVAGNFTGHLEQAGEDKDFTKVKTAEANAPKAVFPTYLPRGSSSVQTPDFLHVYPFDEYSIIVPEGEDKLQIEPECAIVFDVDWQGDQVLSLTPLVFSASNDCSIRKQGATKISQKKNWGPSSKGFAANHIKIDHFGPGGILDRYRIASFLVRGDQVFPYGEDSAIKDYSYFYDKLNTWLINRFNEQKDEGPAENINAYLNESERPTRFMVSVGATRYTDFGKTNFLKVGDYALVVLYPGDVYSPSEIIHRAVRDNLEEDDISVLRQEIIVKGEVV